MPYVDALDGDDVIHGTNGVVCSIYGMHGDDKLSGDAGTDTLNGGAGIDAGRRRRHRPLTGDAGNDYCVRRRPHGQRRSGRDHHYLYDFINLQAYAVAYGANYANTLFAGNALTLSTTPPQKKIVLTGVASKPSATKFLF